MDNLTAAQWVTEARYHLEAADRIGKGPDCEYHWNHIIRIATILANAGFDIPRPYREGFTNIGPALVALSQKIDAENIAA